MLEYPLMPRKISTVSVTYATKRVKFEESAYEQRIATRSTAKHTFRLEHNYLSKDDETLLISFFNSCKGSLMQFRFHNYIDGITYTCNFKTDELRFTRINAHLASVAVEIETA
jgi:hypothetical protein